MSKNKKEALNLQSLITNRRFLLLAVAAGLISMLILFMGVVPHINQILEVNRKLQQEKTELVSIQRKLAELELVSTNQYDAYQQQINQVLPSTKPLIELLATLNNVATSNNVAIANMNLSPGEIASESAEFLDSARAARRTVSERVATQGYEILQVELSTEGSFIDTQNFFLDIEKAAPLITIQSLSLDVDTENVIKANDKVKADLVLATYFFIKTLKVGVDTPLPQLSALDQNVIEEISLYRYPTVFDQQQIIGGGLEDLFGASLKGLELIPLEAEELVLPE